MRIGAFRASSRRTRRFLLLIACIHSVAGEASAFDPPRQDSLEAAIEQTRLALVGVDALLAEPSVKTGPRTKLAPCDQLAASTAPCDKALVLSCLDALTDSYSHVRKASLHPPSLTRNLAAAAAPQVSDAIARLALVPPAAETRRCASLASSRAHPAQLLLAADGRTAVARPLIPLRAGRRYALIGEGLTPAEREAVRSSVVPGQNESSPGGGLTVPAGSFAKTFGQMFSVADVLAGGGAVAALLTRLERSARALPGVSNASGIRVTFSEAVAPERLAQVRFLYVPLEEAADEQVLLRFRTIDPRSGLHDYRRRLASHSCDVPEPAEESVEERIGLSIGLPHDHVERVLRQTYRSLDLRGGSGTERLLGVQAEQAELVDHSYELALPTGFGPDTPLVLLLAGHHGRAESMLASHAESLARLGMASLALDLPEHGKRATGGEEFVDLLDPAVLSRNLRQSAVDVQAVTSLAQECGLPLPDGERFRPSSVRYLGYSLGALVGVLLRAVEPGLGATVLVAPGGGIEDWQLVQLPLQMSSQSFMVCSGGPDRGERCDAQKPCAPPGACVADPRALLLRDALRFPYGLALAGADPLGFATERTGAASKAPLLLVAGGNDLVLTPLMATRLADAYGMRSRGLHLRRGPHATFVQWPRLDHRLINDPRVLEQAYVFLASNGRRVLLPPPDEGSAR